MAWAGGQDVVTPPAQAQTLAKGLAGRAPFELRLAEQAGHFSFMDQPPPGSVEPLGDRAGFLRRLAEDIGDFVCG
jgi:hypothetical protein